MATSVAHDPILISANPVIYTSVTLETKMLLEMQVFTLI